MSAYDLELPSDVHDRKGFTCGRESLERYLRETAKGHLVKGVGITRILGGQDVHKPKPVPGYFTFTSTLVKAAEWPGVAKGLPVMPVPVVFPGRCHPDRTPLPAAGLLAPGRPGRNVDRHPDLPLPSQPGGVAGAKPRNAPSRGAIHRSLTRVSRFSESTRTGTRTQDSIIVLLQTMLLLIL